METLFGYIEPTDTFSYVRGCGTTTYNVREKIDALYNILDKLLWHLDISVKTVRSDTRKVLTQHNKGR